MRLLLSALLYTALLSVANPGLADTAAAAAARSGDMRKLVFHPAPQPGSETPFLTADGDSMTLTSFEGRYVLLNFWATWCAPCRKEMPMLSALERDLGGEDFEVLTVATGRNPRPAMERFFAEINVDNLPLHSDPRMALARDMGVLGLPVTIILNPAGEEIARMQGDADWASESAYQIITTLTSSN